MCSLRRLSIAGNALYASLFMWCQYHSVSHVHNMGIKMRGVQGRKGDDSQVAGGSEDFVDEYLDRPMFQSLDGISMTP